MKNLKKFFAFSIATAMVAGAVCAITPGFKSLAKQYWWNKEDKYVEAYVEGYTEVWKLPEKDTYIDFDYNKLSLSPEKIEVNVNDVVRVDLIGYQYTPDVIIKSCESDDSSVARVSSLDEHSFYVEGIKAGTANISCTVTYKGIDLPTLTKSITVKPDPSVVQSFEINEEEIDVVVGNEFTLTANVSPDTAILPSQGISWDDTNWGTYEVINVENKGHTSICHMRALKRGSAYILAILGDHEKSDSCKINVIARPDASLTLDKESAKLFVGEPTEVTATVKNYEFLPHERIRWESSDPKVARSVNGLSAYNAKMEICGYNPGEATIKAYLEGAPFAYDEFKVVVPWESSKQNATDPNAPTSEEQAKQEQTPESIANYQNWLATYGGGGAAAAPVGVTAVSGEVGQPGSEAIVNTGTGEPVAMFQSNDTTNTLLAAPVGVVPSGTKIETIEAGKDTPAFKAVQNKLSRISRRGTVQKVYGIAGLNPDGSLMTLINGKAAMSMPMPTDITVPAGKSLKVYLIDDNGQTTKLDTAVDQGRVVFEIPKFGTFAFVVE